MNNLPLPLNQWLNKARDNLTEAGFASARIDAELLLASVLGEERTWLLAHSDTLLTSSQITEAEKLLARRLANEPVAYILGQKEFFNLRFKTDNRALIPRWESECLVQAAVDWLKEQPTGQTVAEVGTGCGAIGIAVAATQPGHTHYITEVSPPALALAQENAQCLLTQHSDITPNPQPGAKLGNLDINPRATIHFLLGNLGEPLLAAGLKNKVNLLVANLPYIPSDLLVSLDKDIIYYEPNLALEGGATGLELYEQLMPQAAELLAPMGLLLCEHEFDQGEAMRHLARKYFPHAHIETKQDYLKHDRFLYLIHGTA